MFEMGDSLPKNHYLFKAFEGREGDAAQSVNVSI